MKTVLGMILFAALASFSSTVFRSIGLAMAFNPDALMIVGGGTIVAVFIGFPFQRIKNTSDHIIEAFRSLKSRQEAARDLAEIARIYRRNGIRSLEKKMNTIQDDFLRLGVNLLINHKTNEVIRTTMEKEMAIKIMDYTFSQNVLKTIARLTPAFGLAGTVISLIKMFKNMQAIDTIPPLMAVALMSTFYGVILSNLFMLPLSAKLETHALQSELLMLSTIEGIEAVNNREHPLSIEEKMNGYCETEDFSPSAISETLATTTSDSSF